MIPDSFVIGGRRWTVEKTTKARMPKHTWGDTSFEHSRVRVRTDLSEENVKLTFYHELIHVFLYTDGKLDHDEEFVDRMGSYLKQYQDSHASTSDTLTEGHPRSDSDRDADSDRSHPKLGGCCCCSGRDDRDPG